MQKKILKPERIKHLQRERGRGKENRETRHGTRGTRVRTRPWTHESNTKVHEGRSHSSSPLLRRFQYYKITCFRHTKGAIRLALFPISFRSVMQRSISDDQLTLGSIEHGALSLQRFFQQQADDTQPVTSHDSVHSVTKVWKRPLVSFSH